jgi:hydrogenase-4 membrane subunit HyfE
LIKDLARIPNSLAAAVVGLLLLRERPVHAYIDPGTGSLIYQTALTVVLGLGLVLRRSRQSIVRFVRRLSGRDIASERTGTDRD